MVQRVVLSTIRMRIRICYHTRSSQNMIRSPLFVFLTICNVMVTQQLYRLLHVLHCTYTGTVTRTHVHQCTLIKCQDNLDADLHCISVDACYHHHCRALPCYCADFFCILYIRIPRQLAACGSRVSIEKSSYFEEVLHRVGIS